MTQQKETWEDTLVFEVMEDYTACIEGTMDSPYPEQVSERIKHFEKLKSFISSLLQQAEQRGRDGAVDYIRSHYGSETHIDVPANKFSDVLHEAARTSSDKEI